MSNRARVLAQVFSLLLLCGLIGCDGGDSSSEPSGTPNSSNPPAGATPSPTPTSTPTPTPAPTPTPTPVPTPVPWSASTGSLSSGTWHAAATDPDPTHVGAYGGVSYAPNGDLYLFYDTGTFPGDTMYGKVRRDGGSAWSSASAIGTRLHSAKVYFDGTGKPYLATENAGNVNIYSSSNFSAATPTWDLDRYYPVNESNTSGLYPFGNAFIVSDGTNLSLYFTYLYYNAVTGASLWGLQNMVQTNGVWPSSGLSGTSVDGPNQRPYSIWPHGASGAFADNSGNVLAFSHMALRSTDHGASFSRVMNTGDDTTGLGGVSGSCQNPADGSVILGNFSQASMASPWSFSIWGTRDLGGTFSVLVTRSNVGTPYRADIACVQNLIVAAYTVDGGGGESNLYTIVSSDGGATWAAPSLLVDATSGGTHPSYTFADISLTANATSGSIALMYSLVDNLTPHGVYLKEFY